LKVHLNTSYVRGALSVAQGQDIIKRHQYFTVLTVVDRTYVHNLFILLYPLKYVIIHHLESKLTVWS